MREVIVHAVVESVRNVLQLTGPARLGYTPPFRKLLISNGLRCDGAAIVLSQFRILPLKI